MLYLYLLVSHLTPQRPADHLPLSGTIITVCVSVTVLSDTIHNSICLCGFVPEKVHVYEMNS